MSIKGNKRPDDTPLWICVIVGGIFLAAVAVLSELTDLIPSIVALAFLFIYCAAVIIAYLSSRSASSFGIGEKERLSIGNLMTETLRSVRLATVITAPDGKIIWSNAAMQDIAESGETLAGLELGTICPVSVSELAATDPSVGVRVLVREMPFRARAYEMNTAERRYYMITFEELSEIESANARADDELAVIAYVTIDNLAELAQYARVSYREAANRADEILKAWVDGMDGIMREYDRDKFIVIFPKKRLASAMAARFDVLDQVKNIKTGDMRMSLTVSIGMSASNSGIAEREREAASALETALQRGGDQVVIRTSQGFEYFGGRTKSSRGRGSVTARFISDRLAGIISEAGNVLIMGHKNPDFDCIGASVGLARFASRYNEDVRIVMDRECHNFAVCTDGLMNDPAFSEREVFINAADGMEMIRSDTLLILADVNNMQICESPELAANVFKTVIIDHHRKAHEFVNEPELVYIEPSASSACELVAEMLELASPAETGENSTLTRREADIMLAGIMLDTQDFTRSTTARTFSAALYLRECGASSEIARTFFYEDIKSYITESKLGAEVCIYRERIAIAVGRGTAAGVSEDDVAEFEAARGADRITASKAADKLLTVRGVAAAFVLIETDGEVMISARSDGSINVQLVLEQLGGGGHFDAAGAQVHSENITEVLTRLKKCIDAYLAH